MDAQHVEQLQRGLQNLRRPPHSYINPHDGRAHGWFERHMDFEARRRNTHPEGRFETNTGRHADRYNEWVHQKKHFPDEKRAASAETTRSLFPHYSLAQDQELSKDEERKQRTRSAMARYKADYEKLNLYVHGKNTRQAMKMNKDQWHSGRRAALREEVKERLNPDDRRYLCATHRLACSAQEFLC